MVVVVLNMLVLFDQVQNLVAAFLKDLVVGAVQGFLLSAVTLVIPTARMVSKKQQDLQ